jgi:cytochrome c-type biogenesis protein CcmF
MGVAALVTTITITINGKAGIWFALGLTAAIGLAAATLEHAWRQVAALKRSEPNSGFLYRAGRLGISYWGMVLAHVGVAVFVVGVTVVKTYEYEKDLIMSPGDTEIVSGWRITFIGVDNVRGPNYMAAHGVFELTTGDGKTIHLLEPEKRQYVATGQVMTEAAIDSGWARDIYISLGEPTEEARSGTQAVSWSVRIYLKPFINWIWWGCTLMALGGAITLFDKRYRASKILNVSVQSGGAPTSAQVIPHVGEGASGAVVAARGVP